MTEPQSEPGAAATRSRAGVAPAALGYRMPAEWEPHRGTWLSWPHRESSWPDRFEPVPRAFAEIVKYLAPHEEVHLNVAGPEMEQQARGVLADGRIPTHNVFFHHHPTNDAWCRDHGPIFVQADRPADGQTDRQLIVDWGYNSWGGKYPPYDDDDRIPSRIGAELGIPVVHPGIIMEGGSLDVNGLGTLLTTESCLLNQNRNPTLSKIEIEQYLRDYLGVTRILWLGDGIEGDDTDGHVDDLTRFVGPRTVVTVVEDNPEDPNHEPLAENLERLRSMTDQDGRPLEITTLPMPSPMYIDGQRLPASYANFYIANGVVLLPAYDPPRDEIARERLQRFFPDRRVIPVDCRDLVWGLGAVHCLTQQWPL